MSEKSYRPKAILFFFGGGGGGGARRLFKDVLCVKSESETLRSEEVVSSDKHRHILSSAARLNVSWSQLTKLESCLRLYTTLYC